MVMWDSKAENEDTVSYDGLIENVNERFGEYGWKPITGEELISYLEALERINSVERTSDLPSIAPSSIRWRLKETVKISY